MGVLVRLWLLSALLLETDTLVPFLRSVGLCSRIEVFDGNGTRTVRTAHLASK